MSFMAFELAPFEPSSEGQHHFDQLAMMSQFPNHQNASKGDKTQQKTSKVVEFKIWYFSFIKSSKMAFFAFVLFTCLAMTVGVLTIYFTASKPDKMCHPTFLRTMKSSLVSSSQPRSVAAGDFNHDHQMDIVVANTGANTIGIFLANSNGTFATQKTYPTGTASRPYSIIVSDFNNDSHPDIAVTNYGTNNVGIFLGNGNGTFLDQKIFSLDSSRPLFIIVGDVNKDNRMDIVVANDGTNTIGILLGYGDGSFQDQTTYSTGYDSLPHSVAVGDFNNDNQLDIVVANYGTSNIGILLGHGNGTFTSQQTYTTLPKSKPLSVAVGDFNNDNRLDIVVSNYGTSNVGLFLGHGNGTFSAQRTYPLGSISHPQYITVGDLNRDNKLDMIIADSQNNQVHILPGYGNGSFATITTYDTIADSTPFCIAVADFNNNNQSDIVVTNYDTNNVLVLIDYSIKPSARETIYHGGRSTGITSVAVSDFNNDHILDIVSHTDTDLFILIGLGNGTFGNQVTFPFGNKSSVQYICVGDLNNDNRTDIVIANMGADGVGVFIGQGNGIFGAMAAFSTGISSQPWCIALGDFNHDNHLDIVSTNRGTNTIGILLGIGDGTFSTVVTYSTGNGSAPHAVAVGNINNDNYLDLVVVDELGMVTIFVGQGNGTFLSWRTYSMYQKYPLLSVALADFDSDNYLDIVVANTFNNSVCVLLGRGNGTFTAQIPYSTGSASLPYYVIVADFNDDNIPDIAATNYGSDEVVIFYGYGNGSFGHNRTYSTGFGSKPYGMVAADFDRNKQLEMVVALWGNGDIAVLTGYHAAEFVKQTKCPTGSAPQPFSLAVGDFNNDNRSDIVVANSGTDNLDILFGSNNGTFGVKIIHPIGNDFYPQYVATIDINRDNYLDIVSVNSKNNSISVIMGYGNGTFAEQLIYLTGDGSQPYTVVSGDFNNDNRLDLVVANEGTDSIGIFFGFNYTSFDSQVTYSSIDSLASSGNVVNDFNHDGFQDIAVTFFSSSKIGILLGYGNGTFTPILTYSTGIGAQPYDMDIGDFNNDNHLDIVVTNWGTDNIGVFLGFENENFASIVTYSTGDGSYPIAVAIGDFNNDGRPDIVVANYGTGSVGILLGYGNGTFSNVKIFFTEKDSIFYGVTVGDFNNDRRLDIALANYFDNSVEILLGYGNGTFGNQVTFLAGYQSGPVWLTVGNFNNDNQLDIATANWNDNGIGILLGYGNGSFADVKWYSSGDGSQPADLSVGDFNHDNISNIAVANFGTNDIVVLFGFGDGSFLSGTPYSTGDNSQPFALAMGDFNNDSRLDIVVSNNLANNIGVFIGSDNQPFAGVTTYSTGDGSQPHAVVIGDLNHDARSDIVVANYGNDSVGILLGYGNGTFDSIVTYLTGSGSAPYSVAIADFNNDQHLDIVVTNSEIDNINILFGYGNGTFGGNVTYSTGPRSRPYTVVVGDFNNDNRSDLAIANSGTSNIFLLYGYGNGTFENGTSYPLGYGYHPYSLAVIDLNQDNWMDIVIACYDTDHIETLIKMC